MYELYLVRYEGNGRCMIHSVWFDEDLAKTKALELNEQLEPRNQWWYVCEVDVGDPENVDVSQITLTL